MTLDVGVPSSVLVLAGKGSNLASRENVTLGASQTPDSIHPLSRLVDDRPSQRFIFPALQADDFIKAELQQIANGTLDTWASGEPGSFTTTLTGTGTITEEAVSPKVSGSSAEMANGASGNVELAQGILVQSGDEVELRAHTATSNADSGVTIEIRNLYTGRYLNSAGQWVDYKANCFANAATTLTANTLQFTVESFDLCQRDEVQLQVRVHMDTAVASRTFWVDNLFLIPRAYLVSHHSHNVAPRVQVRVSSSDSDLGSAVPVDGAVDFGGAGHLILNENLYGVSDNRSGTISDWFAVDVLGVDVMFSSVGLLTRGVLLYIDGTGKIIFILRNSAGGAILRLESTTTVSADGSYHHLYLTWDLTTASAELYLDGVDRKSEITLLNQDPYLGASTAWYVGEDSLATGQWNGKQADLWMNIGTYLPVATNLTKFRTTGGYRADVGANGEIPLDGSKPNLYMPLADEDNQGANPATGQTFTVVGTLEQAIQLHGEVFPTSPAFYVSSDWPSYHRYWRSRLQGINPTPEGSVTLGQWVIGDPVELLRNPDQPNFERIQALSQQQLETAFVGETYSVKKENLERRGYKLRFLQPEAAQKLYEEELYKRSEHGGRGIVFVPSDQETTVIHCKVRRNEIKVKQRTADVAAVDLELLETPHGVVSE